MTDQKETSGKSTAAGGASGMMPLTDIIFLTLHHWPWILLSIFICVGMAYVYLLRTPNVYTRSAQVQLKDDSKIRRSRSDMDELVSMGVLSSGSNIQNEIHNLKSKDLMEEVVRRLGLDVNYYVDGSFHDKVVYGYDQPVKLTVVDYPDDGSYSLDLNVTPAGKVTITNLTGSDTEYSGSFTGTLSDTISTPIGKVVVTPYQGYDPEDKVSLKIRKRPLIAARNSYNGRLGVSIPKDDEGSVVNLTMSDQSVQRADDVLNTLIGVYNENWIRDRNQIAVSTSSFINDRLGVIESELGNVDSDISSYKSANLVPDFNAAASMYMSQDQQNQTQIQNVDNQLAMARYIKSYLTTEGSHDRLLPANTGLQNSTLQSLIGEYNSTLLQRNGLLAKSSDKNPLVVQLDGQLDAQRLAIAGTIDNEIIALNTQLKSLRASEARTISRLASNPTQAKNLLSVERQQKVKESLYLFLLQKREENELSQAFTAYNTRVINRPGDSGVPPTPHRGRILGMAFLLGLALPFGVTYLKEMSNTKVRGRKDIKDLTIPFLGEIPQYAPSSKGDEDTRRILVKGGKRDIINEAFRVLRTNVQFMCNSTEGTKVIALTSFNPGSGKSFISVNLGMSMALKGKKVLVIDGDMRHGSTSSYIDSPRVGLASYLSGSESDVRKLIVTVPECDTLSILPIGPVPPNPTELLETPRFASMINNLKGDYDYIIVDCPPIEVVADTQIIDQYVDRTFFIIRAGLFERSMLPDLEHIYDEKKFHNIALILNGTRNEQGRYGYSHSYRYGYGYGYGYGYNYGTDGKKKRKKKLF